MGQGDAKSQRAPSDQATLQHVVKRVLGWTDCSLQRLPGATSAEVTRASNGRQSCVIKRFDPVRWEQPVDAVSAHEATVLEALATQGIPAPRLLAILPAGGVIMSDCPGRVRLPAAPEHDWIRLQAELLTTIHHLTIGVPFRYRSWNAMRDRPAPSWWPDAELWQAASQRLTKEPEYPDQFIHRDYHPLNLLWVQQQISAIVDWTNACIGPAAVDVAHCRLNLALLYGVHAADEFLDRYQALNPGWRHDPYWDLDDAFSTLPEPGVYSPWKAFAQTGLTVALIRSRLVAFVRAALARTDRPASGR